MPLWCLLQGYANQAAGKGIYFAENASYSNGYASRDADDAGPVPGSIQAMIAESASMFRDMLAARMARHKKGIAAMRAIQREKLEAARTGRGRPP